MFRGIAPIVLVPFDENGNVDRVGLQRIVRFELDGGIQGIGINGFASEAYKLTDDERRQTIEIVVSELANAIPLIIGIAPGSTTAAIQQIREFERHQPLAFMTLPPNTMDNGSRALIEHYVALANATDFPIMVQQSPHIPAYHHCELSAEALAEIADRANNIYFKIEGRGSVDKVRALQSIAPNAIMFGGGGGITALDELHAGVSGLIPGVGFNEFFVSAWNAWESGNHAEAEQILNTANPLIQAVSAKGHEYSLHVRKHIMQRAGYIQNAHVRQPTIPFDTNDLSEIFAIVDTLEIRISQ